MKTKHFKLFVIFIVLLSSLTIHKTYSLTMRSVTIKKFIKRTQLAVWATVIKAEIKNGARTVTYRIDQTLKGPRLKKIELKMSRYNPLPQVLGTWVFLALRKNNKGEWLPVMRRGAWPVKYLLKPNLRGFYSLKVPRGLIRGIPSRFQHQSKIRVILPNGKHHVINMKYYLYYEMKKYLKKIF